MGCAQVVCGAAAAHALLSHEQQDPGGPLDPNQDPCLSPDLVPVGPGAPPPLLGGPHGAPQADAGQRDWEDEFDTGGLGQVRAGPSRLF